MDWGKIPYLFLFSIYIEVDNNRGIYRRSVSHLELPCVFNPRVFSTPQVFQLFEWFLVKMFQCVVSIHSLAYMLSRNNMLLLIFYSLLGLNVTHHKTFWIFLISFYNSMFIGSKCLLKTQEKSKSLIRKHIWGTSQEQLSERFDQPAQLVSYSHTCWL